MQVLQERASWYCELLNVRDFFKSCLGETLFLRVLGTAGCFFQCSLSLVDLLVLPVDHAEMILESDVVRLFRNGKSNLLPRQNIITKLEIDPPECVCHCRVFRLA